LSLLISARDHRNFPQKPRFPCTGFPPDNREISDRMSMRPSIPTFTRAGIGSASNTMQWSHAPWRRSSRDGPLDRRLPDRTLCEEHGSRRHARGPTARRVDDLTDSVDDELRGIGVDSVTAAGLRD